MTKRDFSKTIRSKYTVQYMKDWMEQSRDHYANWKKTQHCDEIAQILAGGKWHSLVFPPGDEGETFDVAARLGRQLDDRDRYFDLAVAV